MSIRYHEDVTNVADLTSTLPPAAGSECHLALSLVDSAVAIPGGHSIDLLATPEATETWLHDRGLAPAEVGLRPMCAAQLRTLREQIRALVASVVDGHTPPMSAVHAINDALARSRATAVLAWEPGEGLHLAVSHPVGEIVDRALAVLAADAVELLTGEDASRLAACGSPPCNRYFLRSGRRQWCSTRCGDRARAARAYARRPSVS